MAGQLAEDQKTRLSSGKLQHNKRRWLLFNLVEFEGQLFNGKEILQSSKANPVFFFYLGSSYTILLFQCFCPFSHLTMYI
jgi:hypothetical protein